MDLDEVKTPIYLAFRQLMWIIAKLDLYTVYQIPSPAKAIATSFDLNSKVPEIA